MGIIWFVEIPIIVLVIAAMLIGSVEIGGILRTVGAIVSIASVVLLCLSAVVKNKRKRAGFGLAGTVFLATGILALAIGVYFGEHNLFEFLFGTGWF